MNDPPVASPRSGGVTARRDATLGARAMAPPILELRKAWPRPGRRLAVSRSRRPCRPARPAGADRAQRRGQDDPAQMPRGDDRHRRGRAQDRARDAGRAAGAGPRHARRMPRSRSGCWPAKARPRPIEAAAIAGQIGIDLARADRRARAAASGGARRSSARWRRSPTCCCSTSRPTTSTWARSTGSRNGSAGSRARSS